MLPLAQTTQPAHLESFLGAMYLGGALIIGAVATQAPRLMSYAASLLGKRQDDAPAAAGGSDNKPGHADTCIRHAQALAGLASRMDERDKANDKRLERIETQVDEMHACIVRSKHQG